MILSGALLLIGLVIMVLVSIYLYLIYWKKSEELKLLIERNLKLEEGIKTDIENLKHRKGFYREIIKFAESTESKTTDDYDLKVYVIEEERYLNGYSKIKYEHSDVLGGFRSMQYSNARETLKRKFETIVKTSDITWLEEDKDINQLRREKLENLLDDD